jgi:putative addiction module component (TIGR02574 family)
MSTVSEILTDALTLPPEDRAAVAQSLLRSLPAGPQEFRTPAELSAELHRRLEALASGKATTLDAETTLRRARDAVRQVRAS